jgi:2-polyprenyl-3-methyl-5-hydroxy-6-metoxy-1,4-benzoquinol methylase
MFFYLKLFYLALKRKKTRVDYFNFQKYQANRVVKNFLEVISLRNSKENVVLDYGCGEGAYSLILSKYFKKTIAVDEFINLKENHYLNKASNIKLIKNRLLTYKNKPVDCIFCASVVEHIPKEKLSDFYKSLKNNLKPNGFLYLSFPPFSSPIGGHHSAPFHYLPDKFAFFLTYIVKGRKIISYEKMFGSWGLYKTEIDSIKKDLVSNGFDIMIVRSRFMPSLFNFLFANNNFFNWHCEIICRKI